MNEITTLALEVRRQYAEQSTPQQKADFNAILMWVITKSGYTESTQLSSMRSLVAKECHRIKKEKAFKRKKILGNRFAEMRLPTGDRDPN